MPTAPPVLSAIAAGTAPPPVLSVARFDRQCAAGVYPPGWDVELLDGTLVLRDRRDTPGRYEPGRFEEVGPRHSFFTRRLDELLSPVAAAGGCCFRGQMGVSLPPRDGPQPDGLIARGTTADYRDRNPGPADVLLVAEVALTSLAHDRGTKCRVYATAGLPTYWILDVAALRLEVCTNPDLAAGVYRSEVVLTAADTATVPLPGGGVPLPLADLLG